MNHIKPLGKYYSNESIATTEYETNNGTSATSVDGSIICAWNISDFENQVIAETTDLNGLTVVAKADTTIAIDENSKTADGISFTKRLKLGGPGSPTVRHLKFDVAGPAKIKIFRLSSSSSSDRKLAVAAGSFDNVIAQLDAHGKPATTLDYDSLEYTGEATTIYLYSRYGGVNLYAIYVFGPILVSSISLNNSSLDLKVGESVTLSAIIKPDNATNKNLEWSSSDSSVVSVSNGVVSALSAGTCIVTAKTTDGSNKTATCNVTVKKHPQTIEWNQDLSSIMCGGELVELLATFSSGLPIVFSSSDENVASIFDMGNAVYLNPVNSGMAKITATQAGDNYYEATSVAKDVNVIDPSGVESIMVDNSKYVIHTISGICIGVFSKEEYNSFIKNKPTKGIYIVNGKKVGMK
ncbi:MAG: Ig-like domain-containing protein [Bacteroidaceae bacterium]|nr:Ig-like domain-containing protein [Bacteroidaceae bacterium]